MDEAHGFGGKEEHKLEENIENGMAQVDSDDNDEAESPDQDGEFEPSEADIEAAKKKYGVGEKETQQSLA